MLSRVLAVILGFSLSWSAFADNQEDSKFVNYWNEFWNRPAENSPNPFATDVLKYIKSNDPDLKDISLLDLGAGDGRDSIYFSENGINVTSVDIADESLRRLKQTAPQINTSVQDINNLNLDDETYDVIYAHLSLHYFDDQKTTEIFQKVSNALKPNGILFIKCKSTSDPLYGQGRKVDEDMYEFKHVRHFFSKDYMHAKLSPFNIEQIKESDGSYRGHTSRFVEAIAKKV